MQRRYLISLVILLIIILTVCVGALYLNNKVGQTKRFSGTVTKITQLDGLCKFITINGDSELTVECPAIDRYPGDSGKPFVGFYDKDVAVGDYVDVSAYYSSKSKGGNKFYTLESPNTATYLKVIPLTNK